jgi:hypothetical protein
MFSPLSVLPPNLLDQKTLPVQNSTLSLRGQFSDNRTPDIASKIGIFLFRTAW